MLPFTPMTPSQNLKDYLHSNFIQIMTVGNAKPVTNSMTITLSVSKSRIFLKLEIVLNLTNMRILTD